MMEDPDPYADLKQHRLTPETQAMIDRHRAAVVPKKIQKRHQHFVKVPWTWIERLQGVRRGQTYQVAFCLLYADWKAKGRPVKLANGALGLDGISRQSKWRALADLERLGLIVVEHRPRRSPIIHLNKNLSHFGNQSVSL